MATTEQATEAVRGLRILRDDGLVQVSDGQDAWITTAQAWNAAVEALDDGESDEDAYTTLATSCTPCLSYYDTRGTRDEQLDILRRAIRCDMIEDMERLDMYTVTVPQTLYASDTATDLGQATDEQITASLAAGPEGHIQIDEDGEVIPDGGAHLGDLRRVYVAA